MERSLGCFGQFSVAPSGRAATKAYMLGEIGGVANSFVTVTAGLLWMGRKAAPRGREK